MISRHYGLSISISKIREVAGTDLHGTNIKGLLAAADSLDFDTKGVKATSVNALQEIPLPAIAHVTLDGGLLHYVVIHKVKNGKIYVADPAQGLVTYTLADFCQIWQGILVLLAPRQNFKEGKKSQGTLFRIFFTIKTSNEFVISIIYSFYFFKYIWFRWRILF